MARRFAVGGYRLAGQIVAGTPFDPERIAEATGTPVTHLCVVAYAS